MGMSSRDIQVALMASIVESGLRNVNYGDRDSLGLFQQRAGWGSSATRMNPTKSAALFYNALKRVGNRTSMSLGQAAQKVQVSAFPSRYAVQEQTARALMGKLGTAGAVSPKQDTYKVNQYGGFEAIDPTGMGLMDQTPQNTELSPGAVTMNPNKTAADPMQTAMEKILADSTTQAQPTSVATTDTTAAEAPGDFVLNPQWSETGAGVPGSPLAGKMPKQGASGLRAAVLQMAKSYIGRPYIFGAAGPSSFDCSGLTQYVLGKMGVKIPRLAYQQANFGKQTSIKNIKAGDLIFWGNSSRSQGNHIAFYLGNNMILEAPRPGLSVRIRSLGGWDQDDNAIGIALNY